MRFDEFNEARGGMGAQTTARRMTAPNVSTIDYTAPWTRAQRAKAYKRSVDFNDLKTDKEKFDFLYNLKVGKTTNRIVIKGVTGSYQIKAYNPTTGNIELVTKNGYEESTAQGNVNNFIFQGRTRAPTGNTKNYTFVPVGITVTDTTPTKRGRPPGPSKKQYDFPKLPW
jgi:hypothetical protein